MTKMTTDYIAIAKKLKKLKGHIQERSRLQFAMMSERGDLAARSAFKREYPAQPEAVTLRTSPSPKSTRNQSSPHKTNSHCTKTTGKKITAIGVLAYNYHEL